MKDDKFILPCINCLTLAICKGFAIQEHQFFESLHKDNLIDDIMYGHKHYTIYNELQKKCSIIRDYMEPKLYAYKSINTIAILENEKVINNKRLKVLLKPLLNNQS